MIGRQSVPNRIAIVITFTATCICGSTLAGIKTAADREALFDKLVVLTMAREAWSPVKNKRYQISYPEAFEAARPDFISAKNDSDLYLAITKFSNLRHDRHLKVRLAKGGLVPELASYGVAPIKFIPDYSGDSAVPDFFVADLAKNIADWDPDGKISIGDHLVAINGEKIGDYVTRTALYYRGSTPNGFFWKYARDLTRRLNYLPAVLYHKRFEITLKPRIGSAYTVSLPYLANDEVDFQNLGGQSYPGFEKVLDQEAFSLWRPKGASKLLILQWHGFHGTIQSVNRLVDYAEKEKLWDFDIIFDATRSRGGSLGTYVIQRIQPRAFKTTFGNLRLSDFVAKYWVSEHINRAIEHINESNKKIPTTTIEGVDNEYWLKQWLQQDVTEGIRAGQTYSNNVPFKLAQLPKYSDGILYPAKQHFRGRLICWLSPYGGSHLDQFAAMVADNDLCPILGMPSGGYSNTWEGTEVVTWPGSQEPVVTFMWSIGQTIRPNGEVLEGNPADVDDYIPITAENYMQYYEILMNRTLAILDLNAITPKK